MHLLVLLSAVDGQECGSFWPSGRGAFFEVGFHKMKVTTLDEVETATWRAFRLSLEVSDPARPRKTSLQSFVLRLRMRGGGGGGNALPSPSLWPLP